MSFRGPSLLFFTIPEKYNSVQLSTPAGTVGTGSYLAVSSSALQGAKWQIIMCVCVCVRPYVCVCVCGRVVGIKVWNRLRCSFSVTGCSYHFNTTVEFSIVSRLSSTTMFHLIFVNPFGTLFV